MDSNVGRSTLARRWHVAGVLLVVAALCSSPMFVVSSFAQAKTQAEVDVSHRTVRAPSLDRTMRLFAVADGRVALIRESASTRENRATTVSILVTDGVRVETLEEVPGDFIEGRKLGDSIALSVFDSRSAVESRGKLILVPLDNGSPIVVRELPTVILSGLVGFRERIAVAGDHSIWGSEPGGGWGLLDSAKVEPGLAIPMVFDGSGRLVAIIERGDGLRLYIRPADPSESRAELDIPPETTDICLISDGTSCYVVSSADEGFSHSIQVLAGQTLTDRHRVEFDSHWAVIGGAAMPGALLLAFRELEGGTRQVSVQIVDLENESSSEIWRGMVIGPLGSWEQGSTLLVGDSRGFVHEFKMGRPMSH